jgi:hypothetical protein
MRAVRFNLVNLALIAVLALLASLDAGCAPAPATPLSVSAPPPPPTCATPPPASPAPVPSAAPAAPPPPPAPPPPHEPPPAFTQALDGARKAIAAGDGTGADKQLDAAAAAAGDDAHLGYLVAYHRAMRFAYAGDFDHAAAAFVAVIPTLAKHAELADEFWSHNAMMMIREAQGDPASALAEDDQATLCAARGTWDPKERDGLAFDKDRWHRAYLERMLAESRSGSAKAGLVQYARAALEEYIARGGYPEAIAVLEAYFAALDGKREAALAAAKRVDPAKDEDLEDLYLVVVGLEAGGDRPAAEAVRKVMRQPGRASLPRAIMLRWLELDAKTPRRGFTPFHADAR